MAFQKYAVLDPTQTIVIGFEYLDPASNPDPSVYMLFVESIPPATIPGVNTAVHSGYQIGQGSVSYSWNIVPLTAEQQRAYQDAQAKLRLLTITDLKYSVKNWNNITLNQKDALLCRAAQLIIYILENPNNITVNA